MSLCLTLARGLVPRFSRFRPTLLLFKGMAFGDRDHDGSQQDDFPGMSTKQFIIVLALNIQSQKAVPPPKAMTRWLIRCPTLMTLAWPVQALMSPSPKDRGKRLSTPITPHTLLTVSYPSTPFRVCLRAPYRSIHHPAGRANAVLPIVECFPGHLSSIFGKRPGI